MNRHAPGPICPSCEEKLLTAHSAMRDWFHGVKEKHPNVHIAWAYRGRLEQDDAFKRGATKCEFPNSPHNRTNPVTKKPESLALDLFELNSNGVAVFDKNFYARINRENDEKGLPITWGGRFKTLGDFDHFQFAGSV